MKFNQEIKMITEFMLDNNYYHNGTIYDVEIMGSGVVFKSLSECGYYSDTHRYNLIEVMTWLWSKK